VIVSQELTDLIGDDASTGVRLIDSIKDDIESFSGYAIYDTACSRGRLSLLAHDGLGGVQAS